MLERIAISAPARLHFGLFSVGDAVARKFGGIGLMIDRGKLSKETLAPLDFRTDFPEPWTIVTIILEPFKGLIG